MAWVQISSSATQQEVKKAYRQLSLIYHPDKNPDPAAGRYFAEYITKAYKALTGMRPCACGEGGGKGGGEGGSYTASTLKLTNN